MTRLIDTTLEELISEIKKSLIPEIIKEIQENFSPKKPDEYLTRTETCELLKIDLSTLHRWRKSGDVPCYGISNRVYCKRSEIDELLNKNKLR